MKLRTGTLGMPCAIRSCAGFSLIELLATVTLAAILMAIAVPMVRATLANNRLSAQTNDMIAAITLARSQAITLNQTVTFCRTASDSCPV